MYILIEEYRYDNEDIKRVISSLGLNFFNDLTGKVSLNYVGYYYEPKIDDCVFILPKVLLDSTKNGEPEKVFGKYNPEEIIDLSNSPLKENEKRFISELAVWIYRVLVVYKEKNPFSSIVLQECLYKQKQSNNIEFSTYLDSILALFKFKKENQNFIFFNLRNIHSGFNKINWSKTITSTDPFIQNGCPIYLKPVNKKKQINFDEELLIIYYSILNYASKTYGFENKIDCNLDLIEPSKFIHYLRGFGKNRLLQIKYKYFSDKSLLLWNLCFRFFCCTSSKCYNENKDEYLLVKDFNIVFEDVIDELIGDKNAPAKLKDQSDGKRVDHLYKDASLVLNSSQDDKPVYYIGDSKYYKRNTEVGEESIYKQFTYAKNVIQWNVDIFNNNKELSEVSKLRDDLTEGYNITPNFFISAKLNESLDYQNSIQKSDKNKQEFHSVHFDNRLYDRDTLLVYYYDVNFLFIISLYARNNLVQKEHWKKDIHQLFRKEIQKMLLEKYDFYVAEPFVQESKADNFILEHFKLLNGKIYRPYADGKYFSVALKKESTQENNEILNLLSSFFNIVKIDSNKGYSLDSDPQIVLSENFQSKPLNIEDVGLIFVNSQKYKSVDFDKLESKKIAIEIESSITSFELIQNQKEVIYLVVTDALATKAIYQINSCFGYKNSVEVSKDIILKQSTNNYFLEFDIGKDVFNSIKPDRIKSELNRKISLYLSRSKNKFSVSYGKIPSYF